MDDLTRHADRLPDCDCHECAIYERNRLRAELAACREDADRYRWLREHWDDVNHPVDFIICNSFVTTLDADVDAARKGEGE